MSHLFRFLSGLDGDVRQFFCAWQFMQRGIGKEHSAAFGDHDRQTEYKVVPFVRDDAADILYAHIIVTCCTSNKCIAAACSKKGCGKHVTIILYNTCAVTAEEAFALQPLIRMVDQLFEVVH